MSTSQQKTIDRALAHHKAGEMEQAISLYRQVLRAEDSARRKIRTWTRDRVRLRVWSGL